MKKCGQRQEAPEIGYAGKHICIKRSEHTWNELFGPYHYCKCGHMWKE